jgi:hypothetical protein
MKIGEREFVRIGDLEPQRNADGSVREYLPQARYDNRRALPLHRYGNGPFCKFVVPRQFRNSGVYVIAEGHAPLYVGETDNLSKRFNMGYGNISPKNCFRGGQQTNCRLNNLVFAAALAGRKLTLWFHATPEYKALEAALRASLKPTWNRI